MKFLKILLTFIILIAINIINPDYCYANNANLPKIGSQAIDFNLEGYNARNPKKTTWKLEDFSGSWLILYFYPKDFSSGCTIEARGFKLKNNEFRNENSFIVGISQDTKDEHESFCNSQELGYTLLTDIDANTSKNYGSWLSPYSTRNTFLIDPNGVIKYRWIGVNPVGHAKEVYDKLLELKRNA